MIVTLLDLVTLLVAAISVLAMYLTPSSPLTVFLALGTVVNLWLMLAERRRRRRARYGWHYQDRVR